MSKKRDEQTNRAMKLLEAIVGPEQMKIMADMTKKMGIMIAVRNTGGSKDYDVLTEAIRKDKPYAPKEFVREVVETFYPVLVEEGMIGEDGKLVPDALHVANEYDLMLNEEKRNAN
jgi:hypothetical protein